MSKELKYVINSFQSGTTWIKFNDWEELGFGGFHFGYFDGINHGNDKCINERGFIEKDRYARNICRYLNEASKASGYKKHFKYLPYMKFVLFWKVTRKDESTLVFHDAFFGELEIQWRVTNGNNWDIEPIPNHVMEDLTRFINRSNAIFEDNYNGY